MVSWICQYPGEQSGEKNCENGFRSWMNGSSNSPIPSPENVRDLIDYVTPFLQKSGAAIGGVFPELQPILSQVVPFIGRTQQAMTDAVQFGGMAMCKVLHQNDEEKLVMQDPSMPSMYTVGAFVSPLRRRLAGTWLNQVQVRPNSRPGWCCLDSRVSPRQHFDLHSDTRSPYIGNSLAQYQRRKRYIGDVI